MPTTTPKDKKRKAAALAEEDEVPVPAIEPLTSELERELRQEMQNHNPRNALMPTQIWVSTTMGDDEDMSEDSNSNSAGDDDDDDEEEVDLEEEIDSEIEVPSEEEGCLNSDEDSMAKLKITFPSDDNELLVTPTLYPYMRCLCGLCMKIVALSTIQEHWRKEGCLPMVKIYKRYTNVMKLPGSSAGGSKKFGKKWTKKKEKAHKKSMKREVKSWDAKVTRAEKKVETKAAAKADKKKAAAKRGTPRRAKKKKLTSSSDCDSDDGGGKPKALKTPAGRKRTPVPRTPNPGPTEGNLPSLLPQSLVVNGAVISDISGFVADLQRQNGALRLAPVPVQVPLAAGGTLTEPPVFTPEVASGSPEVTSGSPEAASAVGSITSSVLPELLKDLRGEQIKKMKNTAFNSQRLWVRVRVRRAT
jgi:hypothetical protein